MTDYGSYRLPQLWQMVEHETGAQGEVHEQEWRRQYDLLVRQTTRLRELRDALAAKWPPEKSQAAAVFINEISTMIIAMEDTTIAAAEIKGGVVEATGALSDAREKLQPLLSGYSSTSAAWKAFNERTLSAWLPDWLVPDGPPIPAMHSFDGLVVRAHQQLLDEQARQVMADTDTRVLHAQGKLVELPDYNGIRAGESWPPGGTQTSRGGGSSGSQFSGQSFGGAGSVIPAPRFAPPPLPTPVGGSAEFGLVGGGAALAGEGGPMPSGGVSTSPGAIPGSGYPAAGGPAGGGAGSGGLVPGVTGVPGVLGSRGAARTASGQSGMRPGSVIGPTAGGAGRGAGARGGGARPGGAVPGVLGGAAGGGGGRSGPTSGTAGRPGGGSAARAGGRPTVSISGMDGRHGAAGAGGWRDRSFEEYADRERRERDPDNPWSVDEGVPPVLRPSTEEPRHDPGPGVFGMDR